MSSNQQFLIKMEWRSLKPRRCRSSIPLSSSAQHVAQRNATSARPRTLSAKDMRAILHITDNVLYRSKYAYFTLLLSDENLPSALMLGRALQETGTKYDTVVMVTDSVGRRSRSCLKNVFSRVVDVDVIRTRVPRGKLDFLNRNDKELFVQQMTKGNLFRFTEYKKILFLDSNTLVLKNIDELFDLEPPAGISSLVNSTAQEKWHGMRLPRDNTRKALQLSRGIRGCLMLLKPSIDLYHLCHSNIKQCQEMHFVRPDEEFFTRLFLSEWTHIHAKFALIPWQVNRVSRDICCIYFETFRPWIDECREMSGIAKWRREAVRMAMEIPQIERLFRKLKWFHEMKMCLSSEAK